LIIDRVHRDGHVPGVIHRDVGVGLTLAILADATLIRVGQPAAMRLLGARTGGRLHGHAASTRAPRRATSLCTRINAAEFLLRCCMKRGMALGNQFGLPGTHLRSTDTAIPCRPGRC
jgi:hypothetical protein